MKIPASLKRFEKYIDEIEDYRIQGPEGDGYWIHLKPGWINSADQIHMIHEDNIARCIEKFQYVKPCRCEECLRMIKEREEKKEVTSMPDETKPDCYKCKHRGTVPGDAHSCCRHPEVKMDSNPFGAIVDMLAGKNIEAARTLGIKGHPVGIKKGWFMWPANFDPVWLLSCNGFEPKNGKE